MIMDTCICMYIYKFIKILPVLVCNINLILLLFKSIYICTAFI